MVQVLAGTQVRQKDTEVSGDIPTGIHWCLMGGIALLGMVLAVAVLFFREPCDPKGGA